MNDDDGASRKCNLVADVLGQLSGQLNCRRTLTGWYRQCLERAPRFVNNQTGECIYTRRRVPVLVLLLSIYTYIFVSCVFSLCIYIFSRKKKRTVDQASNVKRKDRKKKREREKEKKEEKQELAMAAITSFSSGSAGAAATSWVVSFTVPSLFSIGKGSYSSYSRVHSFSYNSHQTVSHLQDPFTITRYPIDRLTDPRHRYYVF